VGYRRDRAEPVAQGQLTAGALGALRPLFIERGDRDP
jgi:hypothetical protein